MNNNLDNGKLLVNITEAAHLLSASRSTVYKLIEAGDLVKVKVHLSVRITMDSVRALAQKAAV